MFRVRTTFSGLAGAPYLSTMYFDSDTSGTAQQAATAVGNFWGAVDAHMQNALIWTTEADVAIVNAATGEVTSAVGTTPIVGGGALATEALPRASQGLVRWLSGVYVGGRQVRGRTFIPGLTEGANTTDGLLSPAVITVFNTAAAALIAEANADLEIYSPTLGQSNTATIGSTWNEFAVLRSRRN